MAFYSFNRRFVAGLALTGFMLAAAGCQSSDNGILNLGIGKKTDPNAPIPPQDPKILASQLQAYCPKVTVRDGTAYFNTYAKGAPQPKKKKAESGSQKVATAPKQDTAPVPEEMPAPEEAPTQNVPVEEKKADPNRSTASMPPSVRVPSDAYAVGIPPPPAQMTTVPFSIIHLIGRISKMRSGSGEGTTRRHLEPSCLNVQPLAPANRSASARS